MQLVILFLLLFPKRMCSLLCSERSLFLPTLQFPEFVFQVVVLC